jgi:Domain of unknown function (DUF4340)
MDRRRTPTNLMLLTMVLVLGAATLAEIKREELEKPQPLTKLSIADVATLRVSCNDCQTRNFEKRAGHWVMLEPYILPADDSTVERLLNVGRALVRQRHSLKEYDPNKLGLRPPLATLELGTTRLEIGTTDPIHGDRYVCIGEQLALVPDRFSPFLHESAESELDRHLLPRGAQVDNVSLRGEPGRTDLGDAWKNVLATQIDKIDEAVVAPGSPTPVAVLLTNGQALNFSIRSLDEGFIAERDFPRLAYRLDARSAAALLGQNSADAK